MAQMGSYFMVDSVVSAVTRKHEGEWVLWHHWEKPYTVLFSFLCRVHHARLILSFKTSRIKLFLNRKSWRRRLKCFVYIVMFSQLILQMCAGRDSDGCLLLWKEMKVWHFCFCFVVGFFLPLLCYSTNWNAVQNGAVLSLESGTALSRAYSHL